MGNGQSLTPYEWSSQMRNDDSYKKLCSHAFKLKVTITHQGDGSIQIQDQDNLMHNDIISSPKFEADISRAITEISKIIKQYSTDKGFVHFGYQ